MPVSYKGVIDSLRSAGKVSSRFLLGSLALILLLFSGCLFQRSADSDHGTRLDQKPGAELKSSLSYKGHENDADAINLVSAYPNLIGTRIDDCQACHTAGVIEEVNSTNGEIESIALNPCSYCHLIPFPDDDVRSGAPVEYSDTLNPFGLAYTNHGRSIDAVHAIASLDSDGDGFSNGAELSALRYPGDDTSRPGQETVPVVILEGDDISALIDHTQLMLMNAHSKKNDYYGLYEGVIVKNLLASLGVTLTPDQSVTFIAPDGYVIDFTADRINEPFPAGVWFPHLSPDDFENPEQGFVTYPPENLLPAGLTAGGKIPGEQWIMIALSRDGRELVPTVLNVAEGKISGEGPYRSLIPQGWYGEPGPPDRSPKPSQILYGDGFDFDYGNDHNSVLSVRSLVAIRINPMPAGYEEFDWKNGGFAYVSKKQLIIYGAGITGN